MGKEQLVGNSGCKLTIFKDKVFKVRKESSSRINSTRLHQQYYKILSFKKFKKISVPKIYRNKFKKKMFFYDMEYINGPTLSLYLMSQPVSHSKKILKEIFQFIIKCRKESKSKYKKKYIISKIFDLKDKKVLKGKFFNKIFKTIVKYDWNNIEKSDSHGDLSLENIIIKGKNIKFIDLSNNFVNSYKLDISKIMFDLISFWSFRNTLLKIDNLKLYSLKLYVLEFLNKALTKKDFVDIKMMIILDFLRVLSYTKKRNEIIFLKKKLKYFYGNFNNTLRW